MSHSTSMYVCMYVYMYSGAYKLPKDIYYRISLGPGLCLYALNLGEDNSIVLG